MLFLLALILLHQPFGVQLSDRFVIVVGSHRY